MTPSFKSRDTNGNNEYQFKQEPNSSRTNVHLKLALTVNSKNLYYIKDATNTFRILIDTGEDISIFKERIYPRYNR